MCVQDCDRSGFLPLSLQLNWYQALEVIHPATHCGMTKGRKTSAPCNPGKGSRSGGGVAACPATSLNMDTQTEESDPALL